MKPTKTITVATPNDVAFLVHLQKRWSQNLGFLPRCTHQRYADNKQCLIVWQNDEPAGYLNWTLTRKGLCRIIQVAVEPELLRTTLGTKIMKHIERQAIRGHCSIMRLTTRSDLPANQVWPLLEYKPTATFQRPTTRGLPLIEWTKQIVDATTLALTLCTGGRSKPKAIADQRRLSEMLIEEQERKERTA